MNIKNGYCLRVGLVIGMTSLNALAAPTWDLANNRVTYSVTQDNFELGDNITKSVMLSKLDLNVVANEEGVGTGANYVLSSVVLSMNGVVYGSIYFKNNSSVAVNPTFKVVGYSELSYGADVTPAESYSRTTPIGTIAAGADYSETVTLNGASTPKTVTITEDLNRFLGTGTIETLGAFPVDGYSGHLQL